jgi:hypothetical protein
MSDDLQVQSTLVWNGRLASISLDAANLRALTESAILVEGAAKVNTTPNVQTGDLRRSITRRIEKDEAFVGTPIEYAPWLEFGTRFSRAFPFLIPAFLDNLNKIKGKFKKLYRGSKYID